MFIFNHYEFLKIRMIVINRKYFLRQDKKFIMIENKH
jgi:hypothetical protein